MRTQTFANNEVGLSVRTKLNSLASWNPTYSYNTDDITHWSGSFYSSLIDNNVGNSPSGPTWESFATSASYSLYSESSLSASYAPGNPSISASYADSASYVLSSSFRRSLVISDCLIYINFSLQIVHSLCVYVS
jgi:hypothetical protein